MRAAEDRPLSRRAYFVLNVCRSGTTELTDAIFILAHPLLPVRPGGPRGQRGNAKEILSVGFSVNANHACARARTYAAAHLENFNEI
jgi:hypothetical protein